jgi:hypothetical protein
MGLRLAYGSQVLRNPMLAAVRTPPSGPASRREIRRRKPYLHLRRLTTSLWSHCDACLKQDCDGLTLHMIGNPYQTALPTAGHQTLGIDPVRPKCLQATSKLGQDIAPFRWGDHDCRHGFLASSKRIRTRMMIRGRQLGMVRAGEGSRKSAAPRGFQLVNFTAIRSRRSTANSGVANRPVPDITRLDVRFASSPQC